MSKNTQKARNCEIRKDETYYLKWRLYVDGEFFTRSARKRTIILLKQMFEGDISGAPEWYRLILKDAHKSMSHNDALRYAKLSAQQLKLTATHVNADPASGEPL